MHPMSSRPAPQLPVTASSPAFDDGTTDIASHARFNIQSALNEGPPTFDRVDITTAEQRQSLASDLDLHLRPYLPPTPRHRFSAEWPATFELLCVPAGHPADTAPKFPTAMKILTTFFTMVRPWVVQHEEAAAVRELREQHLGSTGTMDRPALVLQRCMWAIRVLIEGNTIPRVNLLMQYTKSLQLGSTEMGRSFGLNRQLHDSYDRKLLSFAESNISSNSAVNAANPVHGFEAITKRAESLFDGYLKLATAAGGMPNSSRNRRGDDEDWYEPMPPTFSQPGGVYGGAVTYVQGGQTLRHHAQQPGANQSHSQAASSPHPAQRAPAGAYYTHAGEYNQPW
jgi:hypothetical protein